MKKGIAIGVVAVLACCGFGTWFFASSVAQRVRRVSHASPELQAAVARAKAELPTFLQRLKSPKPGDRFAVRGRFMTPNGPEFLWVREPRPEGEALIGVLDERPIALQTLKKGDSATVKLADVADWLIVEASGKVLGGYTQDAMK
jgi:uncharacterized protein YegJ (DUF2314 family)